MNNTLKILIIGRNGQLGWELERSLCPVGSIIAVGRNELDLIQKNKISSVIRSIKPHIIINAAAYTNVDKAEEEEEIATLLNSIAPGILAEEAKRINSSIIHFSTDYVFNGQNKSPYSELDDPAPINVYGKTKLAGENAIKAVDIPGIIIRTSWVYGSRGNNFLLKMLSLARERENLKIVSDQIGCPTWSRSIAEVTAQILVRRKFSLDMEIETLHVTSSGEASWYDFAVEIFNRIKINNYKLNKITPITSEEFSSKAKRPKYSVLDNTYLNKKYSLFIPSWKDLLKYVIEDLK